MVGGFFIVHGLVKYSLIVCLCVCPQELLDFYLGELVVSLVAVWGRWCHTECRTEHIANSTNAIFLLDETLE